MTKKEEVIKELGDIAKLLNIEIDYIQDTTKNGCKREYLVCNDIKIGTTMDSIIAIKQEFFGYVFLTRGKKYLGAFNNQTKNYIKQFWYDDNMEQPYYKNR